jgi:O-antigen/teichoic acid export membrane protein
MDIRNKLETLIKKPALRQGGIVLFDQGFLSIATFVTGVLVARTVSKDDYGLYVLIFSFLLIVSSIHRALVTLPLTIHLPRLNKEEQNVYIGSGLMMTLILGILVCLGLIAYSLTSIRFDTLDTASTNQTILTLTCLIIPFLAREYVRNALFARLHFFSSLVANFTATTLQLTGISALYYYDLLTVTYAITTIFLSTLIAASLMLWSHRKTIHVRPGNLKNDFNRGLSITKWSLLNVLGLFGASQSFIWILLFLMNTEAVAIYGACFALSSVMSPFLRAMNAYLLPRMSHSFKDGNKSNLQHILRTSILALSIPYGIWTLVGSVFAEPLMHILYSDAYQGYGLLVALLLLKSMIEGVSAPLTSTLQTMERQHVTTISLLIGSFIAIAGGIVMINLYGLTGAGIIAVISVAVRATWQFIDINKQLKFSR